MSIEELTELFEQSKNCLNKSNFQQAVNLLEKCIENNPEDVNYYWYLGLAYLLQEQAVEARKIWLLIMGQGHEIENKIEQWIQELVLILETAAQWQEKIGNLKSSWLIRGHIREIKPSLINNLLHLIDLELQLQYYNPQNLENWQTVDYLTNNYIESLDSELFLKILPNLLEFPLSINIDLLYACLKDISDIDTLIVILKSMAMKMAYEHYRSSYAVELIKICLELKPHNLELLDRLYWFVLMAQDYAKMLAPAEQFLNQSQTPDLKAFSYYKIVNAMIINGLWLTAQEILPAYVMYLHKMMALNPKLIDPIMEGCLYNLVAPLAYIQDNPSAYRQLQNQFSSVFQEHLPNWMPWSRSKGSFNSYFPRTLKIGYIAHTLRRHSVGWLSRWLLDFHDRKQFKIYLYLMNQQEDDITQAWFREKADVVYNLLSFPQKISDQIQQDEIDILVDLDSVSHAVTCQVLALKPAPVQVTWLGFDASGLPAIDYFIADPYVLPDNAQDYYQETIWRLPQTYLAVDGFEVAVPTLRREDLGISNDAIIYLTVQAGLKHHPDTIRLQMQILQVVPNSYLLIKGEGDQQIIQQLFKAIAEEYQINFDRLRFLERTPSEEIHRANLSIADVVLDTYPYNGATTTLETLWMGIPLVTKVGKQFAARNSYTFMTNAGLTEGIAWTDEDYIEWGVRLGKDEQLRQQISWKLHQSKKNAPLWNAKQFTQEMEKAYQQMWLKYIEAQSLA
jgi:predicted O-linked N-acetylglucosamine transferase (SPINDLY family)